jgi:hypothetical protein
MRNQQLILAAALAAGCVAANAAGASCDSLASLSLPDTTITLARQVLAGPFTAPGGNEPSLAVASRSKSCRHFAGWLRH